MLSNAWACGPAPGSAWLKPPIPGRQAAGQSQPAGWSVDDPYDLLEEARRDYDEAVRRFVMNEAYPIQRIATLHWVAVQAVALAVILGKEIEERVEGAWQVARLAADLYREHPDIEERAWAHGSLAELWLLRLGTPDLATNSKQEYSQNAIRHVKELVRIYPERDAFQSPQPCASSSVTCAGGAVTISLLDSLIEVFSVRGGMTTTVFCQPRSRWPLSWTASCRTMQARTT